MELLIQVLQIMELLDMEYRTAMHEMFKIHSQRESNNYLNEQAYLKNKKQREVIEVKKYKLLK